MRREEIKWDDMRWDESSERQEGAAVMAEIIILVAVAVTMVVTAVLERGQERVHEAKARRCASGHHFQPPNLWPAHGGGLRVEQVLLVPHEEAPFPSSNGSLWEVVSAEAQVPETSRHWCCSHPTRHRRRGIPSRLKSNPLTGSRSPFSWSLTETMIFLHSHECPWSFPQWFAMPEMRWDEMTWHERKWNEMRWDERKEMRWDEMRWDERKWQNMGLRWNEMRWHEMRWKDMRKHGVRWDKMRWNEMRWEEMRWDERKWENMGWDEMRGNKKRWWNEMR